VYSGLQMQDLFIDSVITIFSRKLKIVAFGNEFTQMAF
jgi:hypothetical protein